MKQWLWFIKIQAVWCFVLLMLVIWLSPDSQTLGVLLAITLIGAPSLWVAAGVTGYWLAVAFDRLTGLGFHLPGCPLTQRHPKSQAIMGAILLAVVLAGIPLTWVYREEMAQRVKQAESGLLGVVISGKPAGPDDGWYLLKYVPGTVSYKHARACKTEAVWLPLKDIDLDECGDQNTASISH